MREKNLKKKKNKNFASCVLVYDVVRFVLRHFSGFLAGFCVLCCKLSRLHQENGLERLKMRFLLKLRACAGVCNKYTYLISVVI